MVTREGWGNGVVSDNTSTDVFVIGGGPAGLAAAIAARQRGLSVTVADGTEPPIDKACGEGLMPETLVALSELGVNIPPNQGCRFRGIRFFDDQRHVDGDFSGGSGLGIRRTVLHQALIDRAEECGVRLLWRTPVVGITPDGVKLPGSFMSSRWVIGADGSSSRVRQWSGLNRAKREEQRYATRRHYRIPPWSDYVEIYWGERTQAYVTPINHEEVCVVVIAESVAEAEFDSVLDKYAFLGEHLKGREISGRERGAVTLMHSLSAVRAGNVALVGDASGGVDAITGEGLRLAFRQAIALSDAINTGDLRRYERMHRELARWPMRMGDLLLTLGRHDLLRGGAIRLLGHWPSLFARMLAVQSSNAGWAEMLSPKSRLHRRFLPV
jgi:flavin-dependent dehydrogenase